MSNAISKYKHHPLNKLIPLDFDLLSLEMEHSFKDVFVENDLSLFTYFFVNQWKCNAKLYERKFRR